MTAQQGQVPVPQHPRGCRARPRCPARDRPEPTRLLRLRGGGPAAGGTAGAAAPPRQTVRGWWQRLLRAGEGWGERRDPGARRGAGRSGREGTGGSPSSHRELRRNGDRGPRGGRAARRADPRLGWAVRAFPRN